MADKTAKNDDTKTAKPSTDDASKGTGGEGAPQEPVVDRVEDLRREDRYERRRVSAEDSFAIQALLALHHATVHRGGAARYLAAAETLGAELADAILGPVAPAAPTDPVEPTDLA